MCPILVAQVASTTRDRAKLGQLKSMQLYEQFKFVIPSIVCKLNMPECGVSIRVEVLTHVCKMLCGTFQNPNFFRNPTQIQRFCIVLNNHAV